MLGKWETMNAPTDGEGIAARCPRRPLMLRARAAWLARAQVTPPGTETYWYQWPLSGFSIGCVGVSGARTEGETTGRVAVSGARRAGDPPGTRNWRGATGSVA